MQGRVRAVEIVVMEIEWEESGAVVTGVVGTGISPLAGRVAELGSLTT